MGSVNTAFSHLHLRHDHRDEITHQLFQLFSVIEHFHVVRDNKTSVTGRMELSKQSISHGPLAYS